MQFWCESSRLLIAATDRALEHSNRDGNHGASVVCSVGSIRFQEPGAEGIVDKVSQRDAKGAYLCQDHALVQETANRGSCGREVMRPTVRPLEVCSLCHSL